MLITDKEIVNALLHNQAVKRSWWGNTSVSLDAGGDLSKKYADMSPRTYIMTIADLSAKDWVVSEK